MINELEHGGNEILNGMKYHFENYLSSEKELTFSNISNTHHTNRNIINKLNHETTAFFNRVGQFYYFAKSKGVSNIIENPLDQIPKIELFKIFRDKQSAHRATDAPRKNDPEKIHQLHKLFSYQYIICNDSILYQILLDNPHAVTGKMSVNFVMKNDGEDVIREANSLINSIKKVSNSPQ